jgi:signal peptidase
MPLVFAATTIFRRMLDLLLLALILIVLSALVVARVIPAITGAPTFVVAGGSMEPTIQLGSVVVDAPVHPADLAVGDVVSIKVGPAQAVFTHRITRLVPRNGALWIQTKGDGNETEDPSIVPATDVIGRVSVVVPGLGYVVQLLASLTGVAFLVSLGMLTLLGAWLLEILEDDQRAAREPARNPVTAMVADAAVESGTAG